MKSILDARVSRYKDYYCTTPIDTSLLDWLTDASYRDQVEKIRQAATKTERDALKAKLPAITPSGIFTKREESALVTHSGFIQFDIDAKDNPGYFEGFEELADSLMVCEAIKEALAELLPYIAYVGISVSGRGLWGLIPIADPSQHKAHFLAIVDEFAKDGAELKLDTTPQSVASLRGYSWDPKPYFNHQATPFTGIKVPKPLAPTKPVHQAPSKQKHQAPSYPSTRGEVEKIERIVAQVQAGRIDITAPYKDWFAIGCALADELGEGGRTYYHDLSMFYPGYDSTKTDKQFDNCLKTRKGTTIATLYRIAAEYGILHTEPQSTPQPIQGPQGAPRSAPAPSEQHNVTWQPRASQEATGKPRSPKKAKAKKQFKSMEWIEAFAAGLILPSEILEADLMPLHAIGMNIGFVPTNIAKLLPPVQGKFFERIDPYHIYTAGRRWKMPFGWCVYHIDDEIFEGKYKGDCAERQGSIIGGNSWKHPATLETSLERNLWEYEFNRMQRYVAWIKHNDPEGQWKILKRFVGGTTRYVPATTQH